MNIFKQGITLTMINIVAYSIYLPIFNFLRSQLVYNSEKCIAWLVSMHRTILIYLVNAHIQTRHNIDSDQYDNNCCIFLLYTNL